MAISTYGVTLKYGATTPNNAVEIKDYPSIMASRSSIETTTLSQDARTYIQGIRETAESFDFTANWDKEVFNALNQLTAVQKWELTFSDGSKFTWDGTVSVSNTDGGVDEVIEMTISVTPTTVPVFSVGNLN